MTPPRVVGLDLSWTGTGMADNQGRARVFKTEAKHYPDQWARLAAIREEVRRFVIGDGEGYGAWSLRPPELVVVESPAFSAQGSAVVDMGGLWWTVTLELRDWMPAGVWPLVTCSPGTLKMFAAGKGTAKKPEVVAAVARREPDLEIRDDNVPDACVLRALGAAVLGYPVPGWENMPKTHARAVDTLAASLRGSTDT